MQCRGQRYPDLPFCEACCNMYIKSVMNDCHDLVAVTYTNQNETGLFMNNVGETKCQYRMQRGMYKGWYCPNDDHDHFQFCSLHVKKTVDRALRFYIDEDQMSQLELNTNRCQNLISLNI